MKKVVKSLRKYKGKFLFVLVLSVVMALSTCSMAFAAGVTPSAIDTGTFTTVTDGAKSVLSLFTEFPINVFLACSIIMIAIGVIKKIKKPN